MITIYAMQKLSGKLYVDCISKISGLYTNSLINDQLLTSILDPEICTTNRTTDYRDNPKFVAALESVRNSSHSSEHIRKSVDRILKKG